VSKDVVRIHSGQKETTVASERRSSNILPVP